MKQFYVVKKISKKKYFELAEQAGKPEDSRFINASSEGCMCIGNNEYLAYTEEDELRVSIYNEEWWSGVK